MKCSPIALHILLLLRANSDYPTLEIVVWIFDTLDDYLVMKKDLQNILKENCY